MARSSAVSVAPFPQTDGSLQIVSIAGGGYRGLFAARVLAGLEENYGSLLSSTNIFAGTSIGAMIALGLAAELPASRIAEVIEGSGADIFPASKKSRAKGLWWGWKNRHAAVHDDSPLRKAVDDLLQDRRMGDLARRVIVPTLDLTAGRFRSFVGGAPGPDATVLAADVAMASAAAPIYLPVQPVNSALHADGGLVANAPDAVVAIEALERLGGRRGKVRMIAVGTTQKSFALPGHAKAQAWGAKAWGPLIADAVSIGQVSHARQVAETLLGSAQVLVIDPVRSPNQEDVLGLDAVTGVATETLKAMAAEEVRAARTSDVSDRFLTVWAAHEVA